MLPVPAWTPRRKDGIWILLVALIYYGIVSPTTASHVPAMSTREKRQLRDQVKNMFLHGYHSYMDHAFPADELMPLSCKGRFRSQGIGRGDVDDAMGNYSLTLVDTLDTLVLLNEFAEFERAVRLVIDTVHFDKDIVVSVFETNIRMLGGLLAAHVLAVEVQRKRGEMLWYQNELLDLSKDLGHVLLEAFSSSTGVPYPRVNLKFGLNNGLDKQRHTCAACAGTMILEFAALSRLTGDPIFEQKSRLAMDYIWSRRHSSSGLVGHIIDVDSGDWIRRESGIGAGSDSYYEYVLKSYILLGDETYLHRFHRHYEALMKYVLKGSRMMDVHMHQPAFTSKAYLDALIAFFPGLQVLYGDVELAKESFKLLYKVVQRYNFLPEAFTPEPDLRMYWSESYLRPEYIESAYFLYTATKDSFYLNVGKELVSSLEQYSRVACGYAALKDTGSGLHDDRMDSFFLAETLKYLYLLFSEPADLLVDLHDYVFTTEAHLLPLHLARKNLTASTRHSFQMLLQEDVPLSSCPHSHIQQPFSSLWKSPEIVLKDMSSLTASEDGEVQLEQCSQQSGAINPLSQTLIQQLAKFRTRTIAAAEVNWDNPEHVLLLTEMGISMVRRENGHILLSQDATKAKSVGLAAEGMILMQELIQSFRAPPNQLLTANVLLSSRQGSFNTTLKASPAQFGLPLTKEIGVEGTLAFAGEPVEGCVGGSQGLEELEGKVAVVMRGGCMFSDKARVVEEAGAIAMVVLDNKAGSSFKAGPPFAMSGDPHSHGLKAITIPAVFLFDQEAQVLRQAVENYPDLRVAFFSD
ncbi:hypothetical protein RvY_06391-2 [Ramazzottius varieornatus]|uniref:alpha-1,2-Mannosidase n=1 Tax=Ramazzottius varieornatus TaxID=947166 RepID=A0A1D1V1D9_RAMVA|nr:hypothetical protein RvY_06391-2 [Ramazzottius varieornatus]